MYKFVHLESFSFALLLTTWWPSKPTPSFPRKHWNKRSQHNCKKTNVYLNIYPYVVITQSPATHIGHTHHHHIEVLIIVVEIVVIVVIIIVIVVIIVVVVIALHTYKD